MTSQTLLAAGDPPPFTCLNPEGAAPLVIICDHAGRAIPRALGDLGLSPEARDRHIAWDIGIAGVAAVLAHGLNAPALCASYSRLVIDCNRRLDDPTSIAQESDRVPIPGNRGLGGADRTRRAEEIFRPYHAAIAATIDAKLASGQTPALLSLHSFTPVMNGFARPWHLGILWNRDARLPVPLMARLAQLQDVCVGDNEPYSGRDEHGYSIIAHGQSRRLPHALIEIRQDLISTEAGVAAWSARLLPALRDVLADTGHACPAA
ncbi:MAG: N-formylglutamate amidohydrolase [Rhodospirillaceae bacterium]|nr:N-formylglutamate amidohydrolase [Rhodospirillaceae bacterium]